MAGPQVLSLVTGVRFPSALRPIGVDGKHAGLSIRSLQFDSGMGRQYMPAPNGTGPGLRNQALQVRSLPRVPCQRVWDRQGFIRSGRHVRFTPLVRTEGERGRSRGLFAKQCAPRCGLRVVRPPPWSRGQDGKAPVCKTGDRRFNSDRGFYVGGAGLVQHRVANSGIARSNRVAYSTHVSPSGLAPGFQPGNGCSTHLTCSRLPSFSGRTTPWYGVDDSSILSGSSTPLYFKR